MLPWIIQMSILSLILIILVHYLFTFFKTNLTIPKVKDLVNKPQKQYEALFDTMKETNIMSQESIPQESNENMKNELKNYLKELSNKPASSISNTPNVNNMDGIMTAESIGSNAYSSF
tara:strand:+ start:62 stop:415 length:354 start_codon:yes stop_codon:yes gene_type:complete